MKRVYFLAGVLAIGALSFLGWLKWKREESKRSSVATLQQFATDLQSKDPRFLDALLLPQSLRNRTSSEQIEFVQKSLRDEISEAGLLVLKDRGQFGPLKEIFPAEADTWTKQIGVQAEECVAFRIDARDMRCEVVLLRKQNSFRIIRCNNVKQLVGTRL